MNSEKDSFDVKPAACGSTTTTEISSEPSIPSCSFTSINFDPAKALATPDLCKENVILEDLYAVREMAHSEPLMATSHVGVEGVAGPGGFPLAKVAVPIIQGRFFTEDQGPLPGKPRKRIRNVLSRMEEVQGPLATLRKCRDSKTRVKVYTRNYCEVRGIMTGYVVAFDKHWNLIMRDVDEIFQKKIQCKTPVFDDSLNFIKVADLSLREEGDPEYKDPTTDPTSMIWLNPFDKKTKIKTNQPEEEKAPEPVETAKEDYRDDYEKRHEVRTTHGRRVDREVLRGSSSYSREARTLRLGRKEEWRDEAPSGERGAAKRMEQTKEGDDEEANKGGGDCPTRHRRRRRKIELRQRHVGQVLVRGENVVLVNVLEV